jgi:hypothetical protein
VTANPPAEVVNHYVGDTACADCHDDISSQYAGHSMGRSLTEFADLPPDSPAMATLPYQFEADGFRYAIRRENGQLIHHQGRITSDGTEMAVIEEPVRYVVGSGHHGQSFLVHRGSQLAMSPVTWYPDKQIWDLSPGYRTNNSEFNRPVVEICLFCHANEAHIKPHTLNSYETPIFRGHAIGCERCHGPGENHVRRQRAESTEGGDDTIVNPAKLPPTSREAVCQQCHLSGVARVLKPGKQLHDFRPGQPLDTCFEIFVLNERPDEAQFVGHVEQMHDSECFQKSDGRLGCVSCHDPHRLPSMDERVDFYRDRCLNCHATDGCTVPEAERRVENPLDNCVDCHMPNQETEVQHTATTNHRIPRDPLEPTRFDTSPVSEPIRSFPTGNATPRDRAIALVMTAESHAVQVRPRHVESAVSVLEQVTSRNPRDVEALVALSNLYVMSQRYSDAVTTCRLVLERQPDREVTIATTAEIFAVMGDHPSAMRFWQMAIEVNPWMSRYWFGLAQAQAGSNLWELCRKTTLEAKRRFPTSIGARQLLVESLLRLGETRAAEQEFSELEAFGPRGLDALKSWFEGHPLRGP